MEQRPAATRVPDPDAAEFIRFCYRRRRVGWPELYDEMCAVAARGLFRGLGAEDLASHGIGFALFDMPALAAMSAGIVAEEQALRRPMTVVLAIDPVPEQAEQPGQPEPSTVEVTGDIDIGPRGEAPLADLPVRFAAVPAGA